MASPEIEQPKTIYNRLDDLKDEMANPLHLLRDDWMDKVIGAKTEFQEEVRRGAGSDYLDSVRARRFVWKKFGPGSEYEQAIWSQKQAVLDADMEADDRFARPLFRPHYSLSEDDVLRNWKSTKNNIFNNVFKAVRKGGPEQIIGTAPTDAEFIAEARKYYERRETERLDAGDAMRRLAEKALAKDLTFTDALGELAGDEKQPVPALPAAYRASALAEYERLRGRAAKLRPLAERAYEAMEAEFSGKPDGLQLSAMSGFDARGGKYLEELAEKHAAMRAGRRPPPDMEAVTRDILKLGAEDQDFLLAMLSGMGKEAGAAFDRSFWENIGASLNRGTDDVGELFADALSGSNRLAAAERVLESMDAIRVPGEGEPVQGGFSRFRGMGDVLANPGYFIAPVEADGTPKAWRELTAEEKGELRERAGEIAGGYRLARKLKRFAQEEIFPVKGDWFLTNDMLYPAARTLPYMAAGAVPYAGFPMMLALNYGEVFGNMIDEGRSAKDAHAVAITSAAPRALIDWGQSLLMFRVGNVAKWADASVRSLKPSTVSRVITRGTAGFLVEGVAEVGAEVAQDFTQELAKAAMGVQLDPKDPDKGLWDKWIETLGNSGEIAMAFVPLVLAGRGIATIKDISYLRNRKLLVAAGLKEEAVRALEAVTDTESAAALLREAAKEADPTSAEAKAAMAELSAEIKAAGKEFLHGARITMDNGVFVVIDTKGRKLGPFELGWDALAFKGLVDAADERFHGGGGAGEPGAIEFEAETDETNADFGMRIAELAKPSEPTLASAIPHSEIRIPHSSGPVAVRPKAAAGGDSARLAAFVAGFEQAFGRKVVFFRDESGVLDGPEMAAEDRRNGFIDPSDPSTIYVNANSPAPAREIVGHEFGHALKQTHEGVWNAVRDLIMRMTPYSEAYAEMRRKQGYSEGRVMDEWVSDVLGAHFDNAAFWKKLGEVAERHGKGGEFRSFVQAVFDWLNDLIERLRKGRAAGGAFLSNEAREAALLEAEGLRDGIAEALAGIAEGGTRGGGDGAAASAEGASAGEGAETPAGSDTPADAADEAAADAEAEAAAIKAEAAAMPRTLEEAADEVRAALDELGQGEAAMPRTPEEIAAEVQAAVARMEQEDAELRAALEEQALAEGGGMELEDGRAYTPPDDGNPFSTGSEPAEGGAGKHDAAAEDSAWKETVAGYYANPGRRDMLRVGRVSAVLRAVGVSDAPMLMPPSVIAKVTGGRHTLTRGMVEQIPAALRDPIMVFDSASEPDAVVVLTEIRHEGRNVVAAIHLDKPAPRKPANLIVSLYDRPASQIQNWVQSGLLRYSHQQKTRRYFQSARLQLPREGSKAGNKKLLTEADVVNREVTPSARNPDIHASTGTEPAGGPVPVAAFKSGELRMPLDRANPKAALKWALDHLRGVAVNTRTGWEIAMTAKVFRHSYNHAKADLDKFRVVEMLPVFLRDGVVLERDIPYDGRQKGVVSSNVLYAPFSLDGETHVARVVLHRMALTGHRAYDVKSVQIKRTREALRSLGGENRLTDLAQAGSMPMNMGELAGLVKSAWPDAEIGDGPSFSTGTEPAMRPGQLRLSRALAGFMFHKFMVDLREATEAAGMRLADAHLRFGHEAVSRAVAAREKARADAKTLKGEVRAEAGKLREMENVNGRMAALTAAAVREFGITINGRTRGAVARAGRIAASAVREWKKSDNADAAFEAIAEKTRPAVPAPAVKHQVRRATGQVGDTITITVREAMKRLYIAQERAAKAAEQMTRQEQTALKRILANEVAAALPPAERGKFLKAIANVQSVAQLVKAMAKLQEALADFEKRQAIRSLRKSAAAVPGKMRPEYQSKVDAIREAIDLRKMTDETRRRLESLAEYLEKTPEDERGDLPASAIESVKRLAMRNVADMTVEEIRGVEAALNSYVALNELKNTLLSGQRKRRLEEVKGRAVGEIGRGVELSGQFQPLRAIGRRLGKTIDEKPDRTALQKYFGELSARPEQMLAEASETLRELIYEGIGVRGHNREMALRQREQDKVFAAMRRAGMPFGRGATRDEGNAFSKWLGERLDVPAGGGAVRMTRGEAVYLYQLALDPDRREALLNRGITLERENKKHVYMPKDADLRALPGVIGETGVKLGEALRETYNGELRADLNREWVDVHYFEIATGTSYTPSRADPSRMFRSVEDLHAARRTITIEGRGMFKDRDKGATAALLVGDAMAVWAEHLDATAKSIAYLKPARDARLLLSDPGVRRAIIDRHGEPFLRFIEELIIDQTLGMQKSRSAAGEAVSRLAERFLGTAARSILSVRPTTPLINFAGLSVSATFLENPANMGRAMAVLGSPGEWARIKALAEQHAPYFRERYDSFFKNVSAGVFGERETAWGVRPLTEYGLAGIEATDKLAGYVRWRAIELDMAQKRPLLTPGSDEFYREVGLEWTRMMYRTESTSHPMDMNGLSLLGRKNAWFAPFVMFQSAASKVYSNMRRAAVEAGRGNWRRASVIAGGNLLSFAMIGALRMAWRELLRGDDEDEATERTLAGNIVREIVSVLPVFGETLAGVITKIETGRGFRTGTPYDNFAAALDKAFGAGVEAVKSLASDEANSEGGARWRDDALRMLDGMAGAASLATGLPYESGKGYVELAGKAWEKISGREPEEVLEDLIKERGLDGADKDGKSITAQKNRAYRAILENDAERFESAVRGILEAGGDAKTLGQELARLVKSRHRELGVLERALKKKGSIGELTVAQREALGAVMADLNRELETLGELYGSLPEDVWEKAGK